MEFFIRSKTEIHDDWKLKISNKKCFFARDVKLDKKTLCRIEIKCFSSLLWKKAR